MQRRRHGDCIRTPADAVGVSRTSDPPGRARGARAGSEIPLRRPIGIRENKAQNDVRKLMAGPEVFICDECVAVCQDIIADDDPFEKNATRNDASRNDATVEDVPVKDVPQLPDQRAGSSVFTLSDAGPGPGKSASPGITALQA